MDQVERFISEIVEFLDHPPDRAELSLEIDKMLTVVGKNIVPPPTLS